MLLFSSGTFTVDGITVFPDHADPNQFWYLPGPVGLESETDSTEPQFLLILYAPDVASAGIQGTGFLNVTLALKVSDMTQAKIIGQIRSQFPDVADPRIAPVPFDEGTVQIVALDMQGSGGASAAPGSAGTGQAVENILGASNPELFGNNDALFALTLSEEGATILEQAFQDGMTPVGGIYNLKFTGVLPALDVKITADLKRAYSSFSVDLTASAYWVSAGIDATFEKLRQDGVIKIDVVSLSNDAAVANEEQWALNFFKDQILAQWFTPSLSPTTAAAADAQSVSTNAKAAGGSPTMGGAQPAHPNPSGGAGTPGAGAGGMQSPPAGGAGGMATPAAGARPPSPPPAGSPSGAGVTPPSAAGGTPITPGPATPPVTPPTTPLTPAPATAGAARPPAASNPIAAAAGTAAAASSAASPFGVALRLKFVSQDELKTVEYEFNQMNAVQRVYAPQGYFGLLLQGIDQSKHFLKVDGTDPFFNHFAVTINPPKDFTGIGLLSAHVALDYGDPSASASPKHAEFNFDPSHLTQQTWDVFEGLIQQTQFTYTLDYAFDPESGWQGEKMEYVLPPVITENRTLTINPYDILGFMQISIYADRIDPSLVDRIEVPLQYTAKSGWQTSTTIIVRPGSAPQTWKLRLADKDDNSYTYSTNCYLKDGTLISSDVKTSTARAIIVNDPFVGALDLTFQPAFDSSIQQAIVELTYQDAAHNYNFQTTFQMQATSQPVKVHIPLMDKTQNTYQYRLSFINSASQASQGSYQTSQDPLVLVSPGP